MTDLIVVADDLTGAMDTGLQFAKRGVETAVSLSLDHVPAARVAVLDTDSRAAPASVAYRRMADLAVRLRGRRIYKKVDSTLRGNVGYELRALHEVLQPRAIVLAPAFPPGGRATLHGRQRVDGRSLELTPFARDPRWPMTESHLPTLLMQQAGLEVGTVELAEVEAGSERLVSALLNCPQRLIVVDAVTTAHLESIAQALACLGDGWVPCGSAGLAEALAGVWGLRSDVARPGPGASAAPVLLVCGSRNEVTRRQLRRAVEADALALVEIDPYRLYDEQREATRLASACRTALESGQSVALTATFAPLVAGGTELVARALAGAVALLGKDTHPGGMFLTGGDIAVATCRALGVLALRIVAEVQPGIPAGQLQGGVWDGLWVVTKAGGFGDAEALRDTLAYLRGSSRLTAR